MLHLLHCRQIVYCWATREALTPMRLVIILIPKPGKDITKLHTNILRVCVCVYQGFPGGSVPCSENQLGINCHAGDRFNPWVRKIPCRRKWKPTLVLPGKSHGQKPGGLQSMGYKKVRHGVATKRYMGERCKQYSISCNTSQNCHHLKVYT